MKSSYSSFSRLWKLQVSLIFFFINDKLKSLFPITIPRHTFLSIGFSDSKFCSQFACKTLKSLNDYVNVSNSPPLTVPTSVFGTVLTNSVQVRTFRSSHRADRWHRGSVMNSENRPEIEKMGKCEEEERDAAVWKLNHGFPQFHT